MIRRVDRSGGERGQILAIFAIGLVTFVLIVGLVIDGGVAFVNRRDAQNIADTAALAGAKVLTDHYVRGSKPDGTAYLSVDVHAAIQHNVEVSNGCTSDASVPCSWSAQYVTGAEVPLGPVVNASSSIPSSALGVVVSVNRTPSTYFLGVVGQSTWNVGTVATAATWRTTQLPPGQLLPIATNPPQPFTAGTQYTLTQVGSGPSSGPEFGPGNFGWLSWTGSNDPNSLRDSICNPDNPEFTMPYTFPGDPGASNSSGVRECLNRWITQGTVMLIPIVTECNPCNGNPGQFTVTGVAAFVLTGFSESGPAINTLQGRFIEYYSLPTVAAGPGSQPPQAGDQTFFVGLVR